MYQHETPLYRWAERCAQRAADWAAARGCGTTWEDLPAANRAGLTGAVLAQVAIWEAVNGLNAEPVPSCYDA